MEQKQKPTKSLHPQLARLIRPMQHEDTSLFRRLGLMLAGSGKRRLATGLVVTVIALASVLNYLAYGSNMDLGTVRLAGVPLAGSDQAMQQQLDSNVKAYRFSISYPDGKNTDFSLEQAGLQMNTKASIEQARQEQRHLGWQRFDWRRKTDVPMTLTKTKAFADFTAQHIAITNKPAQNASLGIKDGKPLVSDGVDGSTYEIAGGNRQLVLAAQRMRSLKTSLQATTVKPTVGRADLETAAGKVSEYTGHQVSFAIGDRTVNASPTDIGNWLDVEIVAAKKTVDVTVNSGKVQAYIDKITASSTYPARPQIMTTGPDGASTMLAAGQDGSSVINKAAVVKAVVGDMQTAGKASQQTLNIAHESYKTINASDYPKWMVADVTGKRMYAYEHNQLVRTFLISAGAPKTPTVIGTYQIYSKVALKTMRGANADGSRYEQKNVKYVNYFYRDYAIHGNYWRPKSYFGNINSSHGCVGITDGDAEWIYNWAPIGTTVITTQ